MSCRYAGLSGHITRLTVFAPQARVDAPSKRWQQDWRLTDGRRYLSYDHSLIGGPDVAVCRYLNTRTSALRQKRSVMLHVKAAISRAE